VDRRFLLRLPPLSFSIVTRNIERESDSTEKVLGSSKQKRREEQSEEEPKDDETNFKSFINN